MNKRSALVAAALVSVASIAAANPSMSASAKAEKEKCYGVAKAGANDCGAADGSHSCAGQAKTDNAPSEWKFVAKGTCEKMGGKTTPPGK